MAQKRGNAKSGGAKGAAAGGAKKTVDEVINSYPEDVQELAQQLRALVKETVPETSEVVKWGNPVFEHAGKNLCYLQGHKGYVRFGFFEQGTQLDDPDGLLEGTGKAMRHVKVRDQSDIAPIFRDWLKQAAAINRGEA